MFSIPFKRHCLVKLTMVFILAAPAICSANVIARMQTSLGVIDVQLYDTEAPLTVANFLSYAKSGAYNNSFIHRSVPGFIIQGGGYVWTTTLNTIAANPPVANEFSPSRSNLRGTIAMAKLGGDPNSATDQWFFNLADNSANLDNQNGGFTVFGQVVNAGMGVVDTIAALPIVNAGGAFASLPLATAVTNNTVQKSNLVIIKQVSVLAPSKTNAADRVFAYLESLYPDKFSPANPVGPNSKVSIRASGYYYRYYAKTKQYVATANGNVYRGVKLGSGLTKIGTLTNLLAKASVLGY